MLTSLGTIILTADSVRDGVDQKIKDELTKVYGLNLVFEKKCFITYEQACKIYPRLVHKYFFSALAHNMTFGPSILGLYEGVDIYNVLKVAKGTFRFIDNQIQKSGLRLKYQGLTKEELIKSGYQDEQLFYRMFEYRIHTCDDADDSLFVYNLLLNKEYPTLLAIKESVGL